ncbi:MAG: hypothetical protein ACYC4U_24125, partial [Pirellulaceae bacterium]
MPICLPAAVPSACLGPCHPLAWGRGRSPVESSAQQRIRLKRAIPAPARDRTPVAVAVIWAVTWKEPGRLLRGGSHGAGFA